LADVAIIAIAPGEGFASVFRGLGVSEVVFGGQTMNPSAQEILDAARRAHARTVIVLPNNGNVVLTAKQASSVAEETLGDDRRILVVGSRTVPQGIGAMMAMTFGADPEAIVSAMTGALTSVRTVEVTRAIRDVSINEIDVRVGDVLGLVDDEVVAAGTEIDEVAARSLELAGARTAELVTIYRGADVSDSDASRFSAALQTRFPNLSVESMTGGQPHYDFIISVE
jgi:dihydroxyacetone kinase-like predicted kinase